MINRSLLSSSYCSTFFISLFTLVLLSFITVTAQSSYWIKKERKTIEQRSDWAGQFNENLMSFYELDMQEMKNLVTKAPLEPAFDFTSKDGNTTDIIIPMPDGSLHEYTIVESPVMEEELKINYPSIKSYRGINKNNKTEIVRFDLGPYGFHALVWTSKGMVQIDPYNRTEQGYYVSYYTQDYESDTYKNVPFCGADHEGQQTKDKKIFGQQRFDHEVMMVRQYRLALACTPTWAASRGTVENCLADMNTMVNRANLIYEKELSVRMVLVAKNDKIVFLDPLSNPYTSTDRGRSLINQNTAVINQKIGTNSYDIGHVLSRCNDVGGIASPGSICTGLKGAGVTCHNNNNIESIVTRVLSHEMGHQMSASHTFNSCGETDQLALGTAFEPGSGTTIMSYAGGCGSDNVAGTNDDYYHVASLDQMLSYTNWTNQDAYICATKIDVANTIPTAKINLTAGFTIPVSTPFELTGEAVDLENDPLTFVWEQYDAGVSSPYGSPMGNVPIFRSLKPQSRPYRFFPNEGRILTGRLTEKDEILPTYTRNLTFRFVVRDNHPGGGAANWDELKFFVSQEAGPFVLKFPFLAEKFEVGQKVKVEWDVANTDKAPVNCKKVNIFLSVNDQLRTGHPNLVPLAYNVENDGEELVILPNYVSNKARIVIKAADNIFLTTGAYPSVISPATKPSFFMQSLDNQREACLPTSLSFEFETEALGGLTEPIQFEVVSGLPSGANAVFLNNSVFGGETNTLTLDFPYTTGSDSYEIVVRSFVPGIDTLERKLYVTLKGTDLNEVQPVSSVDGLTGGAQIQNYNWMKKGDADKYEMQLATNPSFSSNTLVLVKETVDTFFKNNVILDRSTIYYWRVRAINNCKSGEWSEIFAFNTEVSSCFIAPSGPLTINISASGIVSVEGSLFVPQDNVITDLNVKKVKATHERVSDVEVTLISPASTELLLWSKKCGTAQGISVGLDDESQEFFKCPINTGRIYKPDNKLSKFIGESSKGVWKLRIDDLIPGGGGRLQEFDLEICTNVTLEPPSLIKNNILYLPRLTNKIISNVELLAEDNNTSPASVIYTIVRLPKYGSLLYNNGPMSTGQQFSQADLNNGVVVYKHEWGTDPVDNFLFTIDDGQGGWIPVSAFNIIIDQSTSSEDIGILSSIKLFPNPTSDMLTVFVDKAVTETMFITILDVTGKLVYQSEFRQKLELDLSDNVNGVYIVRVQMGDKVVLQKLIKNK
ncbi:MAG: T9SS type A sorting domain-containing protein [Saprospiraceae bacterium]|nr:T9SS type A sorting domain-containing protein [Saprospiraceae bacterium]